MKGRRFIAGAVCPRCGAIDRIAIEQSHGDKFRICVACGLRDAMATTATPKASGRLDRPARPPADQQGQQQPVRFIDPSLLGEKSPSEKSPGEKSPEEKTPDQG